MKKELVCLLAGWLALWLFSACQPNPKEEEPSGAKRTVLVYMAADNNLYYYSGINFGQLLATADQEALNGGQLLVFWDDLDGLSRLFRVEASANLDQADADTTLLKSYSFGNCLTPESMAQVFTDVHELAPADEYGLILWSHGTGWLPADYVQRNVGWNASQPAEDLSSDNGLNAAEGVRLPWFAGNGRESWPAGLPATKWFGESDGEHMDIADLGRTLERFPWEFIMMDACYGASIEFVYELRNAAKYLVASPGEIVGCGFPYHWILPDLFASDTDTKGICTRVCETFHRYYSDPDNQETYYHSSAISLIDLSAVDALAERCRQLLATADSLPYEWNHLQKYDNTQPGYFYDLESILEEALGGGSTSKSAAQASTRGALPEDLFAGAVLLHRHTDELLSALANYNSWIPLEVCCGLSAYVPRYDCSPNPNLDFLNGRYYDTAWAKAIGLTAEE